MIFLLKRCTNVLYPQQAAGSEFYFRVERLAVKKKISLFLMITTFTIFSLAKSYAQTYNLPANGDAVVGKVQWVQSQPGDNFTTIGRRYDIGYFEMIEANPGIDPDHLQPGTLLVIPTQFIIPHVPHVGIVLNVAELRVYYFPLGTKQ